MRVRRGDAIVLAGLVLGGFAVYASLITGGGFMADDWIFRALYLEAGGNGFGDGLEALRDEPRLEDRPIQLGWQAALQSIVGPHAGIALALTTIYAISMCVALYALLRELGVAAVHGAVIAAALLVSPIADSTKLWVAAGYYSISITLFLLGVIAALRAFKAPGRRRPALHALSLLLYLAAIATNELTLAATAVATLVYLIVVPPRMALRRAGVDLVTVGSVLVFVGSNADKTPIADWPEKARTIAQEGARLFAEHGLPLGLAAKPLVLMVGMVIGAALLRYRSTPDGQEHRALRRWLLAAFLAVALIAAAYVVLVPAEKGYRPGGLGIDNRVNALAAIGMIVLAYSTIVLASELILHRVGRPSLAGPVVLIVAGALAAVNLATTLDHQGSFVESSERQKVILSEIGEAGPPPTDRPVLFYFGSDRDLAVETGVPVFDFPYDLTGALRIIWGTYDLQAYPQASYLYFTCLREGFTATGAPLAVGGGPASIGLLWDPPAYFYAAGSQRLRRVSNRSSCLRALSGVSVQPG